MEESFDASIDLKTKILKKNSFILLSMDGSTRMKLNLHGFSGFIYGGKCSGTVGSDLARY